MKKKQDKFDKIGALVAEALRLNRPDFHLFVEIPSHVQWISFACYHGGWAKERPRT
jgi:hypothetical protein